MDYHISTAQAFTLLLLVIWDLVWRGLALWKSAQLRQQGWFVALLIINSVGILPIIYLIINRDHTQAASKEDV
jgi:uncharacterized membrane protein YiaA